MKKLLLLSGIMLMLLSPSEAAADQMFFLKKMDDAIFHGSRSGELTKREVRMLRDDLSVYEKALWKYEKNGKISRRERKKLERVEIALNQKLKTALRNQESVRGPKKRGKASAIKSKKGKRNKGPICRMLSRRQKSKRN